MILKHFPAAIAGLMAGSLLAMSPFPIQAQEPRAATFTGQKYARDAKINIEEARAIALRTYAGEIVSEELEKEKGGSGLRYSFDIKNGRLTHEVGVDAKTGKVLENSIEGRNHD